MILYYMNSYNFTVLYVYRRNKEKKNNQIPDDSACLYGYTYKNYYFEIRLINDNYHFYYYYYYCRLLQLHNRNRTALAYCWPGYRRGPQGTGFGYTACYRSKTTWRTANSQSSSAQIKYLRK